MSPQIGFHTTDEPGDAGMDGVQEKFRGEPNGSTDVAGDELKPSDIERLWRECGLPEWFLGNGGSNHKLYDFAARIPASITDAAPTAWRFRLRGNLLWHYVDGSEFEAAHPEAYEAEPLYAPPSPQGGPEDAKPVALTYGQKLIAEAIEAHFGERVEEYDEDVDDTSNHDAWEAFDAAFVYAHPLPQGEAVDPICVKCASQQEGPVPAACTCGDAGGTEPGDLVERRILIYTIEDNHDVHMTYGGVEVVAAPANNPAAVALLKLDAELRSKPSALAILRHRAEAAERQLGADHACCEAAEQRVTELTGALTEIAKQKLPHELSDDESYDADYRGAYETIVSSSRAVLKGETGDGQ